MLCGRSCVRRVEQEGTTEEDFVRSCSITADGNVVLTGYTFGAWAEGSTADTSMVAVKLDVSDGTVIWRYQVTVLFWVMVVILP